MDEDAPTGSASRRKRHALALFEDLPARYDTLSAALSFWQDPRWRRALVRTAAPRAGERVLDVATGTGMVAAEILASCSDCAVVAIDQSEEMLAAARTRFARDAGRVELLRGQAEALPFDDGSFDVVTVTYLLRYVDDPRATIAELARVLRPGGRMVSLEFGVPPWPPARLAWRLYVGLLLPALGRLASRAWYDVGRFLGPSISQFYARHPTPTLTGYWEAAGMCDVQVRRMSFGGGVIMSARKGPGDA